MLIANILSAASLCSTELFKVAVELSYVDAAVVLALCGWIVWSGTPVVHIGNLRHRRLHYDLSLSHHRLPHWLSHHHLWLALSKAGLRCTSHPHDWLLLLHRWHRLTWGTWMDRCVAHLRLLSWSSVSWLLHHLWWLLLSHNWLGYQRLGFWSACWFIEVWRIFHFVKQSIYK